MKLKKEWNDDDFKNFKKVAKKFFLSRFFDTNNENNALRYCRSFKQIDNILGFAYTSTSSVTAMYICGITAYLDAEHKCNIRGIVLGEDGKFYAFCEDEKENEFFVMI